MIDNLNLAPHEHLRFVYNLKENDAVIYIIFNEKHNMFIVKYEGEVSSLNKEWFSRIVAMANKHINEDIPFQNLSFIILFNKDKKRTVAIRIHDKKYGMPFLFDGNGVLHILNDTKNSYYPAIVDMDEILDIYKKLKIIIDKNKKFKTSSIISLDPDKEV